MIEVKFDTTVTSQFIRMGDVIERHGVEAKVLVTERNEWTREVVFAFENPTGGIQSATIPFDVDVSLGTVTEVDYEPCECGCDDEPCPCGCDDVII